MLRLQGFTVIINETLIQRVHGLRNKSLNAVQCTCSRNSHFLGPTSCQGSASYCRFGDRKKKGPCIQATYGLHCRQLKNLGFCEKFANGAGGEGCQ